MFLWLGRLTDSWRAKKSRGKEIVRVLSAPRASIGFIVLDPLPQMLDEHKVDLMSLTRDRFTSRLMGLPEDTSERRVGESTEPMRDGGYRAPLP